MDNRNEERIGGITILYEDYPGVDLYTDGEIEDEMLDIAMNTPPEEIERVIAERKSWPILYHFSPIRENLLSFLEPSFRGKKILEIGSGCGAVTGCFSRTSAALTCVDLSKKRSLVNAYRHREADNITIRLGNFQDVEKKLDCDYDIITLIGVFEYGSGYIDSAAPYEDFLATVKRHLKAGGTLIIAIENRLGIKYFAGATEDHCGKYFEGIEGYPTENRAKTFSKPALEKLCRDAGFTEQTFYYPFPDYKLPMTVYSDAYLPKDGELRDYLSNFDRERMLLFDEAAALYSMRDDGLFPLFANSFLVLLKGGRA